MFLNLEELARQRAEENDGCYVVPFYIKGREKQNFYWALPHCKQGTVCLCVLLSDLSPWQNLVRVFFCFFFLPNNREGKQAQNSQVACSS